VAAEFDRPGLKMRIRDRAIISTALALLSAAQIGPFQLVDGKVGLFDLPVHAFAYGAVSVWLLTRWRLTRWKVFFLVAVFAAATEATQRLLGGAESVLDLLAAVIGAAAMTLTWPSRRRQRRGFISI